MEHVKTAEARPRELQSNEDLDASLLFSRRLSLNHQMLQTRVGSSQADEEIPRLLKVLRKKSLVNGSSRENTTISEKNAMPPHESRCRRWSYHPKSRNQTSRGQQKAEYAKTNLPRRWFKEYEKKQEEIRMEGQKKHQPLERFRRAVKLIQTCNTAFRSAIHFAVEKGQHSQVTSDATLSLKSTAVKGTVDNLMFDPELYKGHREFLLPHWAKEITNKDPGCRTHQETHLIVQLMKQLKAFRRYSFKAQEALCKAIRYDCFGRRRVVIRKGHVATRFYFIFSGSVCVTVEDDEHSAFGKPTENAVLKRGDYFGELAFIRNLKRAATVVCLEKTELLSIDKEDFFSAKIDECFKADAQKRVKFLQEHQVFSNWPEDVIKKVAVESRLRDYNSDEVIVRDSSDLHWIVFIVEGQCDVLRLLDLSNCKNYIRHAVKYRMERIQDDKAATYRLNTEEASLSSIVTRGFPFITKTAEFTKNPENAVLHSKSAGCYDRFQSNKLPPKRPNDKASAKGIVQSENIRLKPIRTRVCFDDDGKQDPCAKQDDLYLKQDLPASSHSLGYKNVQVDDEAANTDIDVGLIGEKIEGNTGVGVFMAVDRLQSGQCFGAWSLLEQEEKFLPLSKADEFQSKAKRQALKEKKPRERKFTLVSGGCEVIKVAKDVFLKYSDDETLKKLKIFTTYYPRDSILCQTYLQQSDWRTYREEIVDHVVARHIVRLETARGFLQSHSVRSSPVPSPLCSINAWSPSNSRWEYFTDAGWVSGKVTRSLVEGTHDQVQLLAQWQS
ncbi:cyclic nucleotide-binding domain-containing protein 2-like isoform X3 [Acropora muricata]|uniref:cyclic nucleotide-binding domain-containing protein 2-like isoform X3 n=1 Tax=Acropora muricata TaxID=159855 RepID=UPI0034E4FD59